MSNNSTNTSVQIETEAKEAEVKMPTLVKLTKRNLKAEQKKQKIANQEKQ